MKRTDRRGILFGIVIVIALAAIAAGSLMVWKSYKTFDETVIDEKDKQFLNLIQAEDNNLKISLTGLTREVDTWISRNQVKMENHKWIEDGDTTELVKLLDSAPFNDNDICAGRVVYQGRKLIKDLSTETDLELLTKPDKQHLLICRNGDGIYYMAYEKSLPGSVKYYILVDLVNLLNGITGEEQSPEDMTFMVDADCTVMVYKSGELIEVVSVDEQLDDSISAYQSFILDCQSAKKSSAQSIEVYEDSEKSYNARMLVTYSGDTSNGVFAIGKATNYDATLKPSKAAASRILISGGVAVMGVALLLLILILMRRFTNNELEVMRKKNETLKEINREMQELSHHQRLEILGTMTAGIAHDFNNLLTPIMGYSVMTMEMLPADASDLQENLLEVYNASLKAKDIVSRLADLTRNGDEASFADINPDEIIRSALKVTLPVKPDSVEVKIKLNCNSDCIRGDSTQIAQLIMNLTLNAYDAMAEQGGSYFVSTEFEEDKVVMRFRDTGIGMDAETVAKVFDPFFTTKGAGKGTGLGMAIVAHIAEQHDAKVYIESEVGEGTEFKIVFDRTDNKKAVAE